MVESKIKYFVVPAQNSGEFSPRTLLSSGAVKMFVDEAGCLKLRLVDEELLKLRPDHKSSRESIPVFFSDVIVGSDDEGFYIRHEMATEKFRNKPDIIGAAPIRLGEVTSFGISNPPSIQGKNGANQDICKGYMSGVYLNPPFQMIVDEQGQKGYKAITSASD